METANDSATLDLSMFTVAPGAAPAAQEGAKPQGGDGAAAPAAGAAPAAAAQDPAAKERDEKRSVLVDAARRAAAARKAERQARDAAGKFQPVERVLERLGLTAAKFAEIAERADEDPLVLAEAFRVNPERFLEKWAGVQKEVSPEEQREQRLSELEKRLQAEEAAKKAAAEAEAQKRQKEEAERGIAQHVEHIKATATQHADRFPLTNRAAAFEDVFDVMVAAHATGQKVTYEQALVAYEAELGEMAKKLGVAATPDTNPQTTPRTLTNSLASEAPAQGAGSLVKSDEEIRRDAIRFFGS